MSIERYIIHSRAEWLKLRSHDLTASDIGAAAGLDRYKTALRLHAEKTGLLLPEGDSNIMRRGRWMEAAVLEAIREQYPGWLVYKCNVYLRDTERRIGATPDAEVHTDEGEVVNVQCKVVSRPTYERDWADGPPMAYVLQALTEGMLLGTASYLAALVIDTYSADLYLHEVPRHEAAEARVQMIAAHFWQNIANGVRPAADYVRDADTLAAIWPQSVAEPVLDLTGDNRLPDLLAARALLKDEVSGIRDQIEVIDTEIKDKLGAHEKALLPGWKISWKTHIRKEHVVAESTQRPLLVTDLRDKELAT